MVHKNCTFFFQSALLTTLLLAKVYDAREEKSRFEKFSKNVQTILEHNSEQMLRRHTYKLGLNEYADLVSTNTFFWIVLYVVAAHL